MLGWGLPERPADIHMVPWSKLAFWFCRSSGGQVPPPRRVCVRARLLRLAAWTVVVLFTVGGSTAAFVTAGWSIGGWIRWATSEPRDPRTAAVLALLGTISLYYAWQAMRLLRYLVTPVLEDQRAETACRAIGPQEAEPLYQLCRSLARQLNRPCPDEIRLSVEPQCFVVEQRRFGIHTRRRLVLVLGIPQLLVFDVNELKALLAHEFSHLGQDTTTTVFLYRFSEALHRDLVLPLWLKLRMLDPLWWLGWTVLWLLRRIYRPLQHSQEFLADWASASVVGAELAGRTLLKEWWVATQFQFRLAEWGEMPQGWAQWRAFLAEFASQWQEPGAPALEYLRRRLSEEEAGTVEDSHPSISARLEFIARGFPRTSEAPERDGPGFPARELVPLVSQIAGDSVSTTPSWRQNKAAGT